MQIRKFKAQSMQEALDSIKKELGAEAVILETKKKSKLMSFFSKDFFEVTVAFSENSTKKTIKSNFKKNKEIQSDLVKKKTSSKRYIDIIDDENSILPVLHADAQVKFDYKKNVINDFEKNIYKEINDLKKTIVSLKEDKNHYLDAVENSPRLFMDKDPLFEKSFEDLVLSGVARYYAFELVKKSIFYFESAGVLKNKKLTSDFLLDFLANEMMQSILISDFSKFKKKDCVQAIMLVGPPGMGKTTTIAKLASYFLNHHILKIALINISQLEKDDHFWQLSYYAKILNLPFRSVCSVQDFQNIFDDFKNFDLILVDTQGISIQDQVVFSQMSHVSQSCLNLENHLLLSASTREIELNEIFSHFSSLNPKGLIISKLDETKVFGPIFNLVKRFKVPLSFFTLGQKVPEDLELASQERLVSLVMNLK